MVCEALMKIGGCNNEERKDDEGDVLFDEVEREWLEVLGIDENDDDTDDEYLSEELEDDEEDIEDMESDEELIAEGEDELLDLLEDGRIDRTLEDYVEDGANLFSVSELEDLKKKERVLNERNHKGYYRCKIKHAKTYETISSTYQKFITEERLRQLHHPWSTQSNEALNRSVSSLAPKDRTFSKTESLQTRVAIAAAIKNVGHERFWEIIFKRLHISFDQNIRKFLRSLDIQREKQRIRANTKIGKSKRSKNRTEKLSSVMKTHLRDQKDGIQYETGIAMKQATKIAKNISNTSTRNPPGTKKEFLKCRFFHPRYCTVLGHSSCRAKECYMHSRSKIDRDAAAKAILDEIVNRELLDIYQKGTYNHLLALSENIYVSAKHTNNSLSDTYLFNF